MRFEAGLPNESWQTDITEYVIENNVCAHISSFLDDHSRYLISVDANKSMRSETVIEMFTKASETEGYPECVHSDNGTQFTTRYVKGMSELEKVFASLGIKTKHGKPYKLTTQGKIERYHQTLKKFLDVNGPYKNIRQLQIKLDGFRDYYNHKRPHTGADGKPPVVKYLAIPKAVPVESGQLKDFQLQNNKVGREGKVTIRYGRKVLHLGIGRAHKRKKVTIRRIGRKTAVIETTTGEILATHTLNTSRNYQPNTPKISDA